MANVTVTTADKHIDEMWTPELNRAVELDIVIAALFDDRSKQLPHGDILHMPARHNLTANDKSAGSDATPESITETEQTFTVNTHKIVAQEIEDIVEVQSRYELRQEFTQAASYALARVMDVDCGALFDDNSTNTVGVLQSELTDDNLIQARKLLKDNAAPMPWHMVVAPGTYSGFLKLDKFVNSLYSGEQSGRAVHQAQIGKIYGATAYESQLTVGTSPNSSGALWSEKHFFKIVQKAPKTDTWFSPLAKAWIVAADTIYGVFERAEAVEAAAGTTTSRLWGVRLQSVK